MNDLPSYSLIDFIAFDLNTYRSLFGALGDTLWPWQFLLLGMNLTIIVKLRAMKSLVPIYASLSCIVVAWFFFQEIYSQILWVAPYVSLIFYAQALMLIVYALTTGRSAPNKVLLKTRKLAAVMLCLALLVPLSFVLPWSKGSILLFGWGPDQTALGCVGLAQFADKRHWRVALSILPILWLIFQALTVIGISYRFG